MIDSTAPRSGALGASFRKVSKCDATRSIRLTAEAAIPAEKGQQWLAQPLRSARAQRRGALTGLQRAAVSPGRSTT